MYLVSTSVFKVSEQQKLSAKIIDFIHFSGTCMHINFEIEVMHSFCCFSPIDVPITNDIVVVEELKESNIVH